MINLINMYRIDFNIILFKNQTADCAMGSYLISQLHKCVLPFSPFIIYFPSNLL